MEIPIKHHGEFSKIAIVSPEDYDEVMKHKWHYNAGYIQGMINGVYMPMHKLIMKTPPNMVVDHINRIRHDNRRENLRLVTPKENSQNRPKPKNNSSFYRGVTFKSNIKKYQSCLQIDYKTINLGYYENEVCAAEAFDTYVTQNNLIHELNFKEKRDEYLKRPKIQVTVGKRISKYYGVTKRSRNSFQAKTYFDKKLIGCYKTEIEAAQAVDNHIIQQQYPRPLNFPENHPNYFSNLKCVIVEPGVVEIVKNDCKTGILIDENDFECIKNNNTISVNNNGYALVKDGIPLHRYLMQVTDSTIYVDHIDGNRKNNRRSNLRLSNLQLNAQNKRKKQGTTSIYHGVCKHKKWKSWLSTFTINGSKKHIGAFRDEEFAARARDLFIMKNYPDQHYNYNFKWTPEEIAEWQQKLANK